MPPHNRLTQRVEALEQRNGGGLKYPAAWINQDEGESEEEAYARYEAEHGPIGDHFVILWQPVQPGDMQCA